MKTFLKILFYIALLALLGYLLMQLFFIDEYNQFKDRVFHSTAESEEMSDKELVVAYSSGTDIFEPTYFDPTTRSRILNVYEALVKTDRNLQIESALALSWGRLNDTQWEIKLRPNVRFHDGTTFDADDVITSFDRAMINSKSGLTDVLSTITSIKKTNGLTILIETEKPDPLLVNRISSVLIFPSEKKDFGMPVGTGPYKFISLEELDVQFVRYEDYWGGMPYYASLLIKTIPNRFDRIDALKAGDVHILANVPPSFAQELKDNPAIEIASLPSLEVNFLIFNMDSTLLQDSRIRKAISFAFDKRAFVEFSNGFARPSNQFVSNGIFGFNPDIEDNKQDVTLAKTLVRQYDPFKRPSIEIDMTMGTEVVAEYIKEQITEIGFSVKINLLKWEDLRDKIVNKESEMYYLGWRSELGDASSFFENVVHSKGHFNGGNYLSKKVDQLVELSSENLEQKKRSTQLHEIMKIITEEDIFGIPLFESDVVYGVRVGVQFRPRLDGYILAWEVY
ncbi:ABC transporter substrate-binding protein [Patescibacteria group bacterium]